MFMPQQTTAWIIRVLWLIFIAIRIWQEESLMTRQFPESYTAYRKKVRYAILPFLI